jgi:hypothetical protein
MGLYNTLLDEIRDEVASLRRIQQECTDRELATENLLYAEWRAEVDKAEAAKEIEKKSRPQKARGKFGRSQVEAFTANQTVRQTRLSLKCQQR